MHPCVRCVSKLLARYVVSRPLFWVDVSGLSDIGLLLCSAVSPYPVDHAPQCYWVCCIAVNGGQNWRASLQILLGDPAQNFILDSLAETSLKVECIDRIKVRGDAGVFDQRPLRKVFLADELAGAVSQKKRSHFR